MLSGIGKLGLAGGMGFLIGIGLVAYIKPTEGGGAGILIIGSVVVCSTIGGIFAALARNKGKNKDDEKTTLQNDTEDDDESG